jgi:hypothetical protein
MGLQENPELEWGANLDAHLHEDSQISIVSSFSGEHVQQCLYVPLAVGSKVIVSAAKSAVPSDIFCLISSEFETLLCIEENVLQRYPPVTLLGKA